MVLPWTIYGRMPISSYGHSRLTKKRRNARDTHLNVSTAVWNLTQSIPVARIARADNSYSVLVALLCVGMVSVSSLVHHVGRQEKFHQYHQLTSTEEDSKYHGRT